MSRSSWTPDEAADFNDEIEGFTITEAFFATDERYNQGQTPLLRFGGFAPGI